MHVYVVIWLRVEGLSLLGKELLVGEGSGVGQRIHHICFSILKNATYIFLLYDKKISKIVLTETGYTMLQ